MIENRIVSPLYAGILISVGGIAFLSVGGVVGAFLFSVGLVSILMLRLDLYTGRICFINKGNAVVIMITLFMNVLAALAMGTIISFTMPDLVPKAQSIALRKLSEGFSIVPRATLCGVMLFLAVKLRDEAKRVHDEAVGAFVVVLCVMVFILCGFEHSIANVFYFGVAGKILDPRVLLYLAINILFNSIGGIAANKFYAIR